MKKKIFLVVFVLFIFFITGCTVTPTPTQIITPTSTPIPTVSPISTPTLTPIPTSTPTPIPTLTPTPTPTLSSSVYLIIINTTTNKLTLFKNQNKVTSYSVATGKIVDEKCISPNGKFYVMNKVKEPDWGGGGFADPIKGGDPNNPLGHYWMGISAPPRPGHSWGIHGTNVESSIGNNVSHGCIRMYNNEIPILFNTVPVGTNVLIGTSNDLTSWEAKDFD